MINVSARHCTSLNGKWQAIPYPAGIGNWREIGKDKKAVKKTDFVEYTFEGGHLLNVPGDFNSQMPEYTYLEGTVWYKQTFNHVEAKNSRLFLHFGAVNYLAGVYLNGNLIGSHEGGFAPFQFEISDQVMEGENTLIVKVNNQRLSDGIPGTDYDWLNYGGITRDLNLIKTGNTYIEDYNIQLKKHSMNEVLGWVKINGIQLTQKVTVKIPELGVEYKTQANTEGLAEVKFTSEFKLWSPENPKLYKVIFQSETDTVTDEIGFRCISTSNLPRPVFLKR